MSTTHTLFVSGTHCNACKVLIEDTLSEHGQIGYPTVDLSNDTLTVLTDNIDSNVLVDTINSLLSGYGYTVYAERPVTVEKTSTREWALAVLGATAVVALIVLIDRANIASFANLSGDSLLTPLVVGLIASVSTCLAVVGSLVLSVSATYAKDGAGWRPQALFHAGRLGGFLILGAGLGMLGSAFQVGIYGSQMLSVLASIVMLLLGIHLLEVTKKIGAVTLPTSLSRVTTGFARRAGSLAPILIGASTFFLPCGFTQSMQVKALSTGSAFDGGITMFVFALGTLPVLALLSFGSLDLAKSRFRGSFFKGAGILVILFALFNIYSALVVFGMIEPIIL
jgi:sulfite exporter TauE/SafE